MERRMLPEVWIHIEAVGKDKYKVGVQALQFQNMV